MSAAERRKLVKQAGGDEELAKKLAIDNVMKNDKDQLKVEELEDGSSGGGGESDSSSAEPGKKSKKKKKRTPEEKKKGPSDDIFDELDMDL